MLHAWLHERTAQEGKSGMNSFPLHLRSALQTETIEDIASFKGADASGSFGLKAGHERMMSILVFGLVRYRTIDNSQHYVALTGGLLYFCDGELYITTRRYIRGDDYRTVADAIQGVLATEEETMRDLKGSISRLEREMTRRLWRLQHNVKGVNYYG